MPSRAHNVAGRYAAAVASANSEPLTLAQKEQLEAELAELQAALARVDDGTYGIDEVTGQPIDPARLDAMPTARTNIDTGDGTAR